MTTFWRVSGACGSATVCTEHKPAMVETFKSFEKPGREPTAYEAAVIKTKQFPEGYPLSCETCSMNEQVLAEVVEEVQSELDDCRGAANTIDAALSAAESCESFEDLHANLAEALDAARELSKDLGLLMQQLKEGKRRAKEASEDE